MYECRLIGCKYVWSFLPQSVSGSEVKSMAGYDHYEEIVPSPCSPLSCHCRTNMVEILFHPHMIYRHTKVHPHAMTCFQSRKNQLLSAYLYIYIHTYITCLLSFSIHGSEMKDVDGYDHNGQIISFQALQNTAMKWRRHTIHTYIHTYIDNETVCQSSPSRPMAAQCNAWIDEIPMVFQALRQTATTWRD